MTMNQNDHDQIIDQVISLENEFSDPSGAMVASVSSVDTNELNLNTSDPITTTAITQQQQQQRHIDMSDIHHQTIHGVGQQIGLQHHQQQQHLHQQPCVMPMDNNRLSEQQQQQLSTSSEDLLNLLLEFDRDSTNLIGGDVQTLDQDEKIGIETIRKQLMSCEVQSEQLQQHPQQQHSNSMSPIVSPMTCQQPQQQHQPQITPTQQHHHQHQQQQLISQTAPVIPQHQQQHPSLTNSSLSQQQQRQQLPQHHQRLSVDQSLLNGPYSSSAVNYVPVSTSSQPYAPTQQQQQQHQNVSRINQTNPISIVNNSPSPSWQQNQQSISPFSPQQNHHHHQQQLSQQQQRQHHPNATATSPQLHQHLQQQHHPLQQQRSPSQSVSPPVTTTAVVVNSATSEPSPVVKKNPLLNAQLVNSRAPSITPTRFLSNQTNLLNQNPILNSKLSQSPFVTTNSCGTITSPVNPSLNPHNPQSNIRFVQQQHVATNFNYDSNQQLQHHQHTPAQTSGHIPMYGQMSDQQQQIQNTNQLYGATTATTTGISTGATSPPISSQSMMTIGSGNLSQQVKQEIRRKVSQPKQSQHQTTSLLKQLLSDDNK